MSINALVGAFFVLLSLSAIGQLVADTDTESLYEAQLNLSEKLLIGYKKDNRPSYNVTVILKVFINQIASIDDSNQQMKSSINIMAIWLDDRLKWNSSEYNGTEYIQIKAENLWLPDLVILNSASSSIFLSLDSKSLAYVSNISYVAVLYSVPALATRCLIDALKFPMDKQNCQIKISSWALCNEYMDIKVSEVITSFYTENAVWSLDFKRISSSYSLEKDRYSYQDDECLTVVASISLPMARRPLYYMINMIFPSYILTIATMVCFALPAALQFTLTLTIFLNYSMSSVRIASLMPVQSTNMPIVTWYFFGSMMITLLSLGWFVLDFVLRAFSYLPDSITSVCIKIREWSRRVKSKWRSCSCKCKKRVDTVNEEVVEVESEKKPMSEPDQSCVRCQSCGKCKVKEVEKKSADNKKTEFDKNMLCLNRMVFSFILAVMVVFNLACWIFIGSG